jgi:non-heme chloroperoxidase
MIQSSANPGGIPMEVFDGFRAALTKNRAQFYKDVPSGPFYGFNRDGAEISQGLIENWWRQGMAGGAKAHYDCIAAFSETDFTEDLEAINLPVLFLHGEDDQIVPVKSSSQRAIELVRNGALKIYPGLSHGLCATHPELINTDLLAFIREA